MAGGDAGGGGGGAVHVEAGGCGRRRGEDRRGSGDGGRVVERRCGGASGGGWGVELRRAGAGDGGGGGAAAGAVAAEEVTLKTPLPTPMSRHHSSTMASSRFCSRHPSRSDSSCIRCFCSAVNLVRNRFLGMAPPGGALDGVSWWAGGASLCAAAAAAAPGAPPEPRESSMCGGPAAKYGGGGGATGAGSTWCGGGGDTDRSSSYSEASESESESSTTPGSRSSGLSSPPPPPPRCGWPWSSTLAGAGSASGADGGGGGGEPSTARRWKLRWHPHAAHLSDVGSAGLAAGEGMNSPQPSTAWPPRLAAWFLRHSRYIGSPGAAAAAGDTAAGFTFLAPPPLGNMRGLYLASMASMRLRPHLGLTGGRETQARTGERLPLAPNPGALAWDDGSREEEGREGGRKTTGKEVKRGRGDKNKRRAAAAGRRLVERGE
nr:unnamed protein product [Digitaria exilis]